MPFIVTTKRRDDMGLVLRTARKRHPCQGDGSALHRHADDCTHTIEPGEQYIECMSEACGYRAGSRHSMACANAHYGWPIVSRRAVATLEEARQETERVGRTSRIAIDALITESGGSVGPLPDGTVIEVEAATWVDLTKTLHPDWMQQAEFGLPGAARAILAAWNAEQLEACDVRAAPAPQLGHARLQIFNAREAAR